MTEFKKLSAEDIKALEAIMPGRVLYGDRMAEDYDHDEMTEYGRFRPEAGRDPPPDASSTSAPPP